ncbi:tyrosine-type recombinase/integrase [Thermococcus thermotolerans]|uniref:tyrosine-type recombinase/integrase n=1 Tax=Thermococcus thermotolerans TaxID=2969672 RepID=UPI002157F765|nr:site-specific integrase [Thermococcus thermotolerans]
MANLCRDDESGAPLRFFGETKEGKVFTAKKQYFKGNSAKKDNFESETLFTKKWRIKEEHLQLFWEHYENKDITPRHKKHIEKIINTFLEFSNYVVDYPTLKRFFKMIDKKWSDETYNRYLMYVKKLCKVVGVDERLLNLFSYKKVNHQIKIVKKEDVEEFIRIVKESKLPNSEKDQLVLLILLLSVTGMRIVEALKLKKRDIDLESRAIYIQSEYTKKREFRVTFFTNQVRSLLEKHLQGLEKNERVFDFTIYQSNKTYLDKIFREDLNTELRLKDLRKFFIQEWKRKNGDSMVLQLIVGHKGLVTTQNYLKLEIERLKQEYDKVFSHIIFKM